MEFIDNATKPPNNSPVNDEIIYSKLILDPKRPRMDDINFDMYYQLITYDYDDDDYEELDNQEYTNYNEACRAFDAMNDCHTKELIQVVEYYINYTYYDRDNRLTTRKIFKSYSRP